MTEPVPSAPLAYSSFGNSTDVVVLLHSLAMNRRMWPTELIDKLAEDHTVITCDLPGHGESALGDVRTIEDMAELVTALLEALGITRATVVGISMGGCVAQALAIAHPESVSALALLDTTSWYGPEATERWAERSAKARENGMHSLANFQADRWFTQRFREEHPDKVARTLAIFESTALTSYEVACFAMGAVNLQGQLSRISSPTAVAVGEQDYATPYEHAKFLADNIDGASLDVIEGASHLSVIEQPGTVIKILQRVM